MNRKSYNIPLLLILLLALALRLALWWQPLHEPANDENEYITVAYDLLGGRGWEFYTHYHWLRAPLYPLFLAGSLWLTNGDLHLAALPNIALSTATVYLVYLLTKKLVCSLRCDALVAPASCRVSARSRCYSEPARSRCYSEPARSRCYSEPARSRCYNAVASVAALMAALLFTVCTFASLYMSETLFTFLFTASMLLLLRYVATPEHDTRKRLVFVACAGICYGLATLTRSVTLAFMPVVVLWIVATTLDSLRSLRFGAVFRAALRSLLFVACVLLTIAPWTIRNCKAYGRCILVETGLSYNLWAFSEPHESMGTIFKTLESIPNPADRADEATERGMERLREDPTILLRKPWPNWVALWRIKPIQDRFLLPNYYTDPPPVIFLSALLFDDMLYIFILIAAIVGISYTLIYRTTNRVAWLPIAWVLYIVSTTMLTHGEGRYRHFLFPVLIPFAAMMLCYWRAWWLTRVGIEPPRRQERQGLNEREGKSFGDGLGTAHARKVVYVLVSIALIGLALYPTVMLYPWKWATGGAVRSIYRLVGDGAYGMGNMQAAEAAYIRAYYAQKTADGRLILGDLYLEQGNVHKAEEFYQAGWDRKRRYIGASARVGNVLRMLGREDEARDAFEGYFVAQQEVINWSWHHLEPPPRAYVDVGNGLDFGYVGHVYHAEVQQDATARWTNGQGLLRVGDAHAQILTMRIAAPRPHSHTVPSSPLRVVAQVCSADMCQSIELAPTWRVVHVLLPPTAEPTHTVEIRSTTFVAPDGRELGVLVDWVRMDVGDLTGWGRDGLGTSHARRFIPVVVY